MKRQVWAYAFVLCLLGPPVVRSRAVASDSDPQGEHSTTATAAQSAEQPAQAGMRAYFDPKTGKIGPPPRPEAAAAPPRGQNANSTSAEGLVVVPAPRGGQMIDLQGRFQHALTATLKPDGTVETDCDSKSVARPEAPTR